MTNKKLIRLAIQKHCDTYRDYPENYCGVVQQDFSGTKYVVLDDNDTGDYAATYLVTPNGLRLLMQIDLPSPLPTLCELLGRATESERAVVVDMAQRYGLIGELEAGILTYVRAMTPKEAEAAGLDAA